MQQRMVECKVRSQLASSLVMEEMSGRLQTSAARNTMSNW